MFKIQLYLVCTYTIRKIFIDNYKHNFIQCSFVSDMWSDRGTHCSGARSCSYSVMCSNIGSINCRGDQSCSNSYIYDTELVNGYGAYSLYEATINVSLKYVYNFSVNLYGYYSGYKLNIFCYNDEYNNCTVNCYHNGCFKTRIYCHNADNCIVYCDTNMNNSYCADIISLNNFGEHDYDYSDDYSSYDYSIDGLFDKFWQWSITNDNSCDLVTSVSYDGSMYDTSFYTKNDHGHICCRGDYSCYSLYTSVTVSMKDADIICSGDNSCLSPSCVTYAEYVGYLRTNTTMGNGSIFCSGDTSCDGMDMKTNTLNGMIYCGGRISCARTIIANANKLYCNGDWSCYNSTSYGVRNIYLLGSSNLNVDSRPYFQRIYSNGIGEMNVFIDGFESAKYSKIFCNVIGDICNVFCRAYESCDTVSVICDYGKCNIYCPKSDDDYNYTCVSYYRQYNITIFYITLPPTEHPTFLPETSDIHTIKPKENITLVSTTSDSTTSVSTKSDSTTDVSTTLVSTSPVSTSSSSVLTTSDSDSTILQLQSIHIVMILVILLLVVVICLILFCFCLKKYRNSHNGIATASNNDELDMHQIHVLTEHVTGTVQNIDDQQKEGEEETHHDKQTTNC